MTIMAAPGANEIGTADGMALVHADYERECHFVVMAPRYVHWVALEELLVLFGLELMDEDECPSEPQPHGWVKVWCAERMVM